MTEPEQVHLVLFEIDGQVAALRADAVLGLSGAVALTALPGAPPPIEGVVDHHGELVAVLDGRALRGRPARPVQPSDHLIYLRPAPIGLGPGAAPGAVRPLALRVDRVLDLFETEAHALGIALGDAAVARIGGALAVIEDPARFLTPDDRARLEHALAGWRQGAADG